MREAMNGTGHTLMRRNWTELIRPRRMEVEDSTHTPFYGKFVCEPLERGFGITLGNSLRRVSAFISPGRSHNFGEN